MEKARKVSAGTSPAARWGAAGAGAGAGAGAPPPDSTKRLRVEDKPTAAAFHHKTLLKIIGFYVPTYFLKGSPRSAIATVLETTLGLVPLLEQCRRLAPDTTAEEEDGQVWFLEGAVQAATVTLAFLQTLTRGSIGAAVNQQQARVHALWQFVPSAHADVVAPPPLDALAVAQELFRSYGWGHLALGWFVSHCTEALAVLDGLYRTVAERERTYKTLVQLLDATTAHRPSHPGLREVCDLLHPALQHRYQALMAQNRTNVTPGPTLPPSAFDRACLTVKLQQAYLALSLAGSDPDALARASAAIDATKVALRRLAG